ncbi:MAG: glycogen debranching N-terminal domain-containing protein [Nocardioidaceae bacterium]
MPEISRTSDALSTGIAGETQPYLHDLVSCVRAPGLALSGTDGQIRPGGAQGWFHGDRRALSCLLLRVGADEPAAVAHRTLAPDGAAFVGVSRTLGDDVADPTIYVDRDRKLGAGELLERIWVSSAAQGEVVVGLQVTVSSDLAGMDVVKSGGMEPALRPTAGPDTLCWQLDGETVTLSAAPCPREVDAVSGTLRWSFVLTTGQSFEVTLRARHQPAERLEFTGATRVPWTAPQVSSDDPRLTCVLQRSLADLTGLLLADTDSDDVFLAAGSPWFLTLFGRDSLWAARMLLPLGTQLALSTLRVLARRQGTERHAETEEEPGKILHEVRRAPLRLGTMSLPPRYYGSVDATPLWVSLLADAWRWGAPRAEVSHLLPAAEQCLAWLEASASSDGFLRYVDHSGHGLSNQGWKDSHDSIQWADGRLAEAPIALSEVQGYAYAAARDGAMLLEAFDRPGADRWRAWAETLRCRFAESFWVADERGPYPAVALDAAGRAVNSVASNMAHLLGTGILDGDQAGHVADRLSGVDMDSGFGLRTLSNRSRRYARLSYHGGTVWPHDTAIAALGLAKEGFSRQATALLRGLTDAAPAFDHRLPELFGGDARSDVASPTPYPAACRPQAWAAAASVAGLTATLGLQVDVPSGDVVLAPSTQRPFGRVHVTGLRVGNGTLDVTLNPDDLVVGCTADDVRVRVEGVRGTIVDR